MSRALRSAIIGVVAALSFAPAALGAQAPIAVSKDGAADSLAFPRQFVKWVFTTQGDSAFARAGTALRESMRSAEAINQMSGRIAARFGDVQATEAEVQFDEGPLKVYIAAMRFAQASEPGAWVVVYSPESRIVERASFGPLSNVKARYPMAKLP